MDTIVFLVSLSWQPNAINAVAAIFADISAVVAVLSVVITAPAYKLQIAIFIYFIGAGVATYFVSYIDKFLYSWIAAILSGALSLFLVRKSLDYRYI